MITYIFATLIYNSHNGEHACQNQHSSLPRVERKDATYMRYRVKEECGLCGKTLLLRPHLKTAHNLKTWDEYILKLKGKGGKKSQRKQGEEKQSVSWGLHSLLQAVKTTGMVQRESREANEGSSSSYEDKDTPPSPTKSVRVNFSEDEFLRFCVHNTNSYMVRATHQAIATKRKDPINVLHYLSKNKLSIENCKYIVDMNFIPKLYGYYRFASYYPYPKGKCISCSSHSCLCGKLARSFYSFCRRACSPLFNCTVCKKWGSGYHTCADFFECDFCSAAAKKWPPKVPFKC